MYLDANVFVYALEGEPALRALALSVLDAVDTGEVVACTGEITLAEVLVAPYRQGNAGLAAAYETLLGPRSPVDVFPTTAQTWRDAARLRSQTALQAGADVFLTHDHRLVRVETDRISVHLFAP